MIFMWNRSHPTPADPGDILQLRGHHGTAMVVVEKHGCVVVKTIITHPPNRHFYRWYKPFPNLQASIPLGFQLGYGSKE
jgi:hypothetical protein